MRPIAGVLEGAEASVEAHRPDDERRRERPDVEARTPHRAGAWLNLALPFVAILATLVLCSGLIGSPAPACSTPTPS